MLRNEAYVGIIVYGRNLFKRDSETGNRISRPAETRDIVYQDAPELQIVGDATWNIVQERLERTDAEYTHDGAQFNASHRARCLLAQMISCDCCGGVYTIKSRDRDGCYNNKNKGSAICGNSNTIKCETLKRRVLARVKAGLVQPDLASHFAAEVRKTPSAAHTQDAGDGDRLTRDLAKLDQGIARVLDLIKQAGAPSLLLSRQEARQAERGAFTSATAP